MNFDVKYWTWLSNLEIIFESSDVLWNFSNIISNVMNFLHVYSYSWGEIVDLLINSRGIVAKQSNYNALVHA